MASKLRFLSCSAELFEAKAVLMGCPLGYTESGACTAPDSLRLFSKKMDDYHLVAGTSLSKMKLHDCGDVDLKNEKVQEDLEEINQKAFSYFEQEKFLLTLGGSREASYGLLKAAHKKYEGLKVITIDAHHGMESIEDPINGLNYLSHAIHDFLPKENVIKMGIREGSEDSYQKGLRRHKHLPPRVKKGVIERIPKLYHVPVYLSIDIDVLDPSCAPGVIVPSSCGVLLPELIETVQVLQGVPVVGVDILGYVPSRDVSDITASAIFRLVKEVFTYFL